MHREIANWALEHGAVIFGGWPRDVILLQKEPKDIDMFWPRSQWDNFHKFWETIRKNYKVKIICEQDGDSREDPWLFPDCEKVMILEINDVPVELGLYRKEIEDWFKVRNLESTVGLFWHSKDTELALRYIPKPFEKDPDPFKTICKLTKDLKFVVILERPPHLFDCQRIKQLSKTWRRIQWPQV